ncbi:MAG: hypothetical protein EF807_08285 [Candidatus Methanolliviera hydrocarbonicum]|uniref:Uncharacterized protein n=1 Tax=Candidatus Methanolliviera hydrocarbonicum TaxID=2491085 RepID=A0A520KUM3_9EURY|nr:MAG: hypothetical protein EF807_08285 [Candidatus Methanolliviera hydrocarbonicum]
MFEDRVRKEDIEELVNIVMDTMAENFKKNAPILAEAITEILKIVGENIGNALKVEVDSTAWREVIEFMKTLQGKYEDYGYEGYR